MNGITIEELQARHSRLAAERTRNQEQLGECQAKEHGFRFVLGELEMMIADLEQRQSVTAESALEKEK